MIATTDAHRPSNSYLHSNQSATANQSHVSLALCALGNLNKQAIASVATHPGDFVIPFARVYARHIIHEIEEAGFGIIGHNEIGRPAPTSLPKGLDTGYHNYLDRLERLRNACGSLKRFGGESPSDRYRTLLQDYQEIFETYDWKLGGISQLVNFRATTASLAAAQASLKESRKSIEQNHTVKKLTQLAFIFIPLSFVTGAFGMNLSVLNTGSAKTWQVVVSAVVVYVMVAVFWTLQEVFGTTWGSYFTW